MLVVAALLFISAAPPSSVLYHGRWDLSGDAAVCAWPMSGFSVRTNGATSLSATMTPGADGAKLKVLVDGHDHAYVTLPDGGSKHSYALASGLSSDPHNVSVYKVTEDFTESATEGALRFHDLSSDGELQPMAQPRGARRLEFIGDSDTAGWCADGKPYQSGGTEKYENAAETWAAQLAKGVGAAETSTVAVSGWGVTQSSGRIQDVYPNTFGYSSKSPKWNFSYWTPDAVVILIGPNDEAAAAHLKRSAGNRVFPNASSPAPRRGEQFIKAYLELMNVVATAYQGAAVPPKIVHVCGGSMNGLDPCDDIEEANNRFNEHPPTGFQGYYTTIGKKDWEMINTAGSEYKGCQGHYSPKGHKVIADDIQPQLEKIMGW